MPDVDIDSLREIHFSDCDPAFFPDDEEDPEELRANLQNFEELLDWAEIRAGEFYDDHRTLTFEKIRSYISKSHLLVEKLLEDL